MFRVNAEKEHGSVCSVQESYLDTHVSPLNREKDLFQLKETKVLTQPSVILTSSTSLNSSHKSELPSQFPVNSHPIVTRFHSEVAETSG